ncbi:MAG TPA: hypothetical protein VGM98_01735 [Schlesneria sp.]|jgi:hypothetical protein
MTLIDVAIPLVGGALLLGWPRAFIRVSPSTTPEQIAASEGRYRKIGGVLFLVAAGYYVVSMLKLP